MLSLTLVIALTRESKKMAFSQDDNFAIASACGIVRRLSAAHAAAYLLAYGPGIRGTSTSPEVLEDARVGSEIWRLIHYHEWEKLFQNERWLALLGAAQNLSPLQGSRERDVVFRALRLLAEKFPEA